MTIDKPTLFVVGYTHLDTQWCWTYPQVIREFIPNTLHENFALFDKYPDYVFNWTGSNRYRFIKEYYPEDYARLKKYVADGHWFPGGSSIEEGDVNSPSEESLIRQVLYGNEFFRKEFGKQSEEFTLPDCFGFPASLPSILAHCGLDGFSTQKLTWGSAVGIPFNVGNWVGPDGESVVAALNATSYGSHINGSASDPHDLKTNPYWVRRMQEDEQKTGVPVDFRYYGNGDRGGSVDESDLKNLLLSEKDPGPFDIYAGRMDMMFISLTDSQKAKLPTYTGDLELTNHSAGSLTSEATQKKWNRENEVLADATERASVAADWLGALPYDRDRITDGWLRFLPGQFHDLMAGTALPLAYTFTWNDEILAMNEFAGVLQTAVGATSRALDTRGQGIPIVVYNPLSVARQDVVEATVDCPAFAVNLSVDGPSGPVPSQIVSAEHGRAKILFLAGAPSVGYAVYHATFGSSGTNLANLRRSALRATNRTVENARYKVTLNGAGDIASIYDKAAHKEMLAAPARLEYQHENPSQYPAWNMDWSDQSKPPADYVSGTPKFKIVENGPVRVGLQVTRRHKGSTFIQTIRLAAGAAGNRIEFATKIDWQGKESALKADFPLTVSNPQATYNWELGTIKRGNNDPKKFEVASHQWFDLTAPDKSYGVSVLDQAKYGSDKPSDNDLRLTLLYTPGVRGGYQHQGHQDWGHHEFVYALCGHAGTWQAGKTQWESARLSQPLIAFESPAHEGTLGKSFSFARVDNPNISIEALKKAEDTNEYIVRTNELSGSPQSHVRIAFASPVVSAREVDGQERSIGPAKIEDGKLVFDTPGYRPRAFAIKLAAPAQTVRPVRSYALRIPYNLDGISSWASKTDGNFDGHGRTLPGELMPNSIVSDGIGFHLGPKADGAKNVVVAEGQTIALPKNKHARLYVLAASVDGDTPATFSFGAEKRTIKIQAWNGYIGQWDTRLWEGQTPELAYDWHNPYAGLVPGFIKRARVAWYADHRRLADGTNDIYAFAYLYRYGMRVPDGARSVVLPNNPKVRILAVTIADDPNDDVRPLEPLYENTGAAQPQTPSISPAGGSFRDSTVVTLGRPMYWSESEALRYTTDGSLPTAQSPVYSGPFRVDRPTTLTVAQFGSDGKRGRLAVARLDVRDVTPPSIRSVIATPFEPTIRLTFSEPLDKASAESVSNYSLSSGTAIQSASLSADGQSVVLGVSSAITADPGTVTVKGVKDAAGNAADATAQVTLLKPVLEVTPEQSFDGRTTGPTQRNVADLPTQGGHPWTINMFVWVDQMPAELTPIAGFGDGRDSEGAERFLIKFHDAISFWGSNVDVRGKENFDLKRWQMVTATYDGQTVRLYKDGREIGSEAASLSDASNAVRFAPRPAWGYGARFSGKIRGFTVWDQALSSDALKGLMAGG